MKTHYLKTLSKFFEAVLDGTKTAELRLNDRDFQVGDKLVLQEIGYAIYKVCGYTGREVTLLITHVLTFADYDGLKEDYVMLSFKK